MHAEAVSVRGQSGYPVDNLSFYCVWRKGEGGTVQSLLVLLLLTLKRAKRNSHIIFIFILCAFLLRGMKGGGGGEDGVGGECMEKILNKICCACVNNFEYSNTFRVL